MSELKVRIEIPGWIEFPLSLFLYGGFFWFMAEAVKAVRP